MMFSKSEFSGKRALVTGAGKGIGRKICVDLAANGAFVIAVSRTSSDLVELKKELDKIRKEGSLMIVADLAKVEDVKRVALEAGDVDLLVNNAGIAKLDKFLDLSVDDWDDTLNINLRSAFLVSQYVIRGMVKRGVAGSVVNVSSQASSIGLDKHVAYCASKGGMDQLTRVMALELGKYKIRVNSVNPTVVLTEMGKKNWSAPDIVGPMLKKIPLGKFADPVDVSNVVLFLLSEKSGMVNGVALPIDGGFLSARL